MTAVVWGTHVCTRVWCCLPSWLRLLTLFFVANVLGDIVSFPFAHTFWNVVGFEGWFHDHLPKGD